MLRDFQFEKKEVNLHVKQFPVCAETDGGLSSTYYVGTDLWDMM